MKLSDLWHRQASREAQSLEGLVEATLCLMTSYILTPSALLAARIAHCLDTLSSQSNNIPPSLRTSANHLIHQWQVLAANQDNDTTQPPTNTHKEWQ